MWSDRLHNRKAEHYITQREGCKLLVGPVPRPYSDRVFLVYSNGLLYALHNAYEVQAIQMKYISFWYTILLCALKFFILNVLAWAGEKLFRWHQCVCFHCAKVLRNKYNASTITLKKKSSVSIWGFHDNYALIFDGRWTTLCLFYHKEQMNRMQC